MTKDKNYPRGLSEGTLDSPFIAYVGTPEELTYACQFLEREGFLPKLMSSHQSGGMILFESSLVRLPTSITPVKDVYFVSLVPEKHGPTGEQLRIWLDHVFCFGIYNAELTAFVIQGVDILPVTEVSGGLGLVQANTIHEAKVEAERRFNWHIKSQKDSDFNCSDYIKELDETKYEHRIKSLVKK